MTRSLMFLIMLAGTIPSCTSNEIDNRPPCLCENPLCGKPCITPAPVVVKEEGATATPAIHQVVTPAP